MQSSGKSSRGEGDGPAEQEGELPDNTVRPATPSDTPPAGDARHDQEKLRQNREHLRVNEEHKTPEMEKGHRGTFP